MLQGTILSFKSTSLQFAELKNNFSSFYEILPFIFGIKLLFLYVNDFHYECFSEHKKKKAVHYNLIKHFENTDVNEIIIMKCKIKKNINEMKTLLFNCLQT